jgi:hypothetical protein
MAASDQELWLFRGGRRLDKIQGRVDSGDTPALQKILAGWLEQNRWGPSTHGEFSIVAFEPRRREVRL